MENKPKKEGRSSRSVPMDSSPIGPGYYVGGRRFDMDGLPAMD